jgi:hypothetical protein
VVSRADAVHSPIAGHALVRDRSELPTTTIGHTQLNQVRNLGRRERYTVSTTDPQQPATRQPPVPSIQDIFGDTPTLQSAEDLARDGIFDDGEVEELIADLYAMRRSDVA